MGLLLCAFALNLIKISQTSIKPGNPALWQDSNVRSNLNYYITEQLNLI